MFEKTFNKKTVFDKMSEEIECCRNGFIRDISSLNEDLTKQLLDLKTQKDDLHSLIKENVIKLEYLVRDF